MNSNKVTFWIQIAQDALSFPWEWENIFNLSSRGSEKIRFVYQSPLGSYVNLLTLWSDQHLVSPYNITPESHIKITGIKEMITN